MAGNSGNVLEGLGLAMDRVVHLPMPTRALYWSWANLGVPKADSLLGGVDVYHATNFFLPPTKSARRVVTVHDLAFLKRPDWCSPKVVGPFSRHVRRFVGEADAVLACSESTKADAVDLLGVPPDKVTVAWEAADEDLRPMPREEASERLRRAYGIEPPFLLFVGTIEPRKNVEGLLRAFAHLADDVPHSLVLVGSEGWSARPVEGVIGEMGLAGRVVRPGYVPRQDLPAFYSAADVFVFPSLYEGFGLPVLESFACGCPVVTSTNSSLPEVAGDAALLVDAEDVEGIAASVRRVVEDQALRESLVARGHKQERRFSWRACAETTLGVYRSLA